MIDLDAVELEARDAALDDGECADPDAEVEGDCTVPSVVKMKLGTFCNNMRLRCKLNAVVKDMNRVIGEAYAFANFHVRRIMDCADTTVDTKMTVEERAKGRGRSRVVESTIKLTLQPLVLPTIDKNFYYRCILAVTTNRCRPSTLGTSIERSIKLFDALRPEGYVKVDVCDYNQVVADLSKIMATMATNHLLFNASHRVKNYLCWRHPELRRQHNKIVGAVVYKPGTALQGLSITAGSAAAGVVQTLRSLLTHDKRVRYAKHAHTLLPLYHHLLTRLEEEALLMDDDAKISTVNPRSKKKTGRARPFTLLPMKAGFTVSHVPISSMMLLKLLQLLGLERMVGDGRHEDAGKYWRRYFNINLVETRARAFANRIVTDGFAVGIVMSRRTRTVEAGTDADTSLDVVRQAYRQDSKLEVSAVDPGFRDVATIANKDGSTRSYSSARYYHDAKISKSVRHIRKLNAETSELTDWGVGSDKSVTSPEFLTRYLASLPELLRHRMERPYRSLRFLRYTGKQKAIHDIAETIAPSAPGKTILVFFGNWSGGSQSPVSRRTSGPLVEVKKALRRRSDVLFRTVDESYTSRKDHNTWEDLVYMRAMTTRRKKNDDGTRSSTFGKVFSVLHCQNSAAWPVARRETTWNRDVNAAKNILMLGLFEVLGYQRPAEFSKQSR